MKITAIDINGTPHVSSVIDALCHGEILPVKDYESVLGSGIVAKSIDDERYAVLVSNSGQLFNPLDRSANISDRDRRRGGPLYKMKTCTKTCFEYYCAFLRSKNRTSFILAQRSLI